MVFSWPWKSDDSSPASFEKALSILTTKISKRESELRNLRQRLRRLTVLWTLYAGFAYLLYTIVLVVVMGWRVWGLSQYASVTGGPLLIWLVRLGLSAYYTYRISSIQVQSEELQKQRDAKIEKLKIATKYNSTQELLQKYSGNPTPNSTSAGTSKARVAAKSKVPSNGPRTPFVPPPTANIPDRDEPPPFPRFPQNVTSQVKNRLLQEPEFTDKMSSEIAPNAFSAPFQYAPVNEGLKWYDRLMDVLMGEDETRAAARLALICSSCRLVNGQAPPGVRCLEDLGKWRCSGCGAMNEEETEAGKIMAAIEDQSTQKTALYMNKGRKNGPAQEGEIASDPVDNEYESDVTRLLTGGPEGGKEVIQVMEEDPKPLIEPDNLQRRPARLRKGKKAG